MGIKLLTGNGCRVSAEDDRAFNMATISKDMFVFKGMGEMFRAEIISNNCIRIHSGEGMIQGAHFRTPYGEYDDVTINNGTQGKHRYDIIAIQYERNTETLKETTKLVVIEGKQYSKGMSAYYPSVGIGDLYKGDTICQFPLYDVYIDELSIKSIDPTFGIMCSMRDSHPVGSLYFSMDPTEPSKLFGGVWQQIKGRTLIGVDEEDDDFNKAGNFGGEKEHTLTVDEIPGHIHKINTHRHTIPALSGTAASSGLHNHSFNYSTSSSSGTSKVTPDGSSSNKSSSVINDAGSHTHNVTTNASNTGYSGDLSTNKNTTAESEHNNLPPYITCYMWVRTA